MTPIPKGETIINIKSLAELMLESNKLLVPDVVSNFDEYLVSQVDFDMLVKGACGGEYPHGLIQIMQGRLGFETDEQNFVDES